MDKVATYQAVLLNLETWDDYLLQESGLPGPRGNIELAQAVTEIASEKQLTMWLAYDVQAAPTNSPYEFLAFCGVLGQGKLLAEGNLEALKVLRSAASDPRWRIREAVAMALQRYGRGNMESLLAEMEIWSHGNWLEKRAAAAALCEPELLVDSGETKRVLKILNLITGSILTAAGRSQEGFKALRKGLGYCWSVAVVANPSFGKPLLEKWIQCADPDVQWIMGQNLKKKRLERLDAQWVSKWLTYLT